ncbi:MAG: Slp family lipoprotein [Psychromonas sp.]
MKMSFIRNISPSKLHYIFVAMLLTSCSSNIPEPISAAPAQQTNITEVQKNPEQSTGLMVRWGGVINKVENLATHTRVEIISKELNDDGEPKVDSSSKGRFIANYSGFVDPIIYKKGEYITIVGKIERVDTELIGEYAYPYPIVSVDSEYLWTELGKEKEKQYYPNYMYDDPWGYPHRSYYRRPYYR